MKVAICGVRHGHICGLAKQVRERDDMELVAVAESNPEAAREYLERGELEVTHESIAALLSDVECDAVAVGDVYKPRGEEVIQALEAGKHVVSDKPLCITLDEYYKIEALSAEKNAAVIVQLTLRYTPAFQAARKALLDGVIGEIATAAVFGRHPLNYGAGRPAWYFEEGVQGGTINDLFVHGMDGLEFLTGLQFKEAIAARAWNAELREVPFFQDAAQGMFRLNNGGGVIMDCSYKAPRGHAEPWVLHFNGDLGDMDVNYSTGVTLRLKDGPEKKLDLPEKVDGSYLDDLATEVAGAEREQILTTSESLRATRLALLTQRAADEGKTNVGL